MSKPVKNLVLPEIGRYFLVGMVILSVILLFWIVSPFFNILVYAALTTVIFGPFSRFFRRIVGGNETIAAFISTAFVLIVFLVPLTFFTFFVAQEAVSTYQLVEHKAQDLDFSDYDFHRLDSLPWVGEKWKALSDEYNFPRVIRNFNIDLVGIVKDATQTISTFLVSQSGNFAISLGDAFIKVILLLLTIFYFFRDGDKIYEYVKAVSPLPAKYEDEIAKKLKGTIYGIVVGGFGSSVIQGVVGAIGLKIVGVEYIAFLGAMMGFASLIPYIGASVIWLPICLGLLIDGQSSEALFLAIWGLVLISTVDNFVKPFLIGTKARMYPLATFFVVMGGLFVIGLSGIIYGPLILSLALTLFHIYKMEYKDILKA